MLGRLPPFDIVVGCTLKKRGIGLGGKLPWDLPSDMAFFKNTTKLGHETNVCIMGRSTLESIGKTLPGRHNIVLSKNSKITTKNVHQASSLRDALDLAKSLSPQGRYFVIGGQKIFEEAIPDCRYIYETRINKEFECDRFMPEHNFPAKFISKTFRQNGVSFDFCQFQNPKNTEIFHKDISYGPHEEYQYINLLREIMETGEDKMDRTKTGTRSVFGRMMRFDLSQSFPLLTTKKVFWRGVAEELLWFIRASTNGNELKQKKIGIWDGNGSRQYLDSIGLKHRLEGDLGPIYGFQWRHWNAPYVDMHSDYHGKGIDQLQELIKEIKTNPQSRRLIMSAWNPGQLKEMALPPCHIMCQFNVSNDSRLNCLMYQRSCDMGLGVPFNIASYSLLTCLIAQICNLKRGQFIHTMGDCHIYNNHIDTLKPQLDRQLFPFPYLTLNPQIKNIDDFRIEDINLSGYVSHDKIKMRMAV